MPSRRRHRRISRSRAHLIPAILALVLVPAALVQAAMVTGTYTGDGQFDRTIDGLGFEPAVVIIKGDVAESAILRTASMPPGWSKQLAQERSLIFDRILGTTADGFRVGNDADVNASGAPYWYIAFSATPGTMTVGSYTGDGATDRAITGLGLDPGLVVLIPGNTARCRFRTADMPPARSLPFDDVSLQEGVLTGLQADGFRVDADWRANEAGTTYHYLAFATGTATASWGSYLGDGSSNRVINGSGFQPRWVLVKSAESKPGLHLTRDLSAQNSSLNFWPEANLAGGLDRMVGQGFVVDGHERVNEVGKTLYWAAFTSSDDLADVSVQLAADTDPVELGGLTTVTATIANAGPQAATGATVTVDLPADLILESTAADPGVVADASTPSRISLAWDIPAGEQRQVALGLRVARGASTRSLTGGAASDLADPATTDNAATLELSVPSADLALALAAAPPTPLAGDTLTVTATLANHGPGAALAAEVVPVLPPGLTLVAAQPGTGAWDGDAGVWSLTGLAAGDTAALDLLATVGADQAGATLPVAGSVTASRNDPDPANDTAAVDVTVAPGHDLRCDLVALPAATTAGDTVTVRVVNGNAGPGPAPARTTSLTLPAGLSVVGYAASAGSFDPAAGTWTAPDPLPVAGADTLDVQAAVSGSTGGDLPLAATVALRPGELAPADDHAATILVVTPLADLTLTAAVDPLAVWPGETASLDLTLAAAGPGTAPEAAVQLSLPAGLTAIASHPEVGTFAADTGIWSPGVALAPGDQYGLQVTLAVAAEASGPQAMTATVSGAQHVDPQPDDDAVTLALDVQTTVPVAVHAVPFATEHRVLRPGGAADAVLRLRLRNGGGAPAVLDSLALSNALTGVLDQDAQDAVWHELALRDADGTLLGAGAFSGGLLALGDLGLALAAGDSLDLVLHGGVALDAPDGLRLQPELASGGVVFADTVLVQGDWPLAAPGTLTVDGMTAAQIGRHPVAEGIFQMGSARNLALDATIPGNGGQPDVLTKLNVVNLGSAAPRTVVTRVEAWADDGDGRFDPAADPRIGELHWTGGQRFEASALAVPIPAAGLRIMVTVDVAEAALGGTVQLSLPAGDDPAIGVASGNDGPVDVPVSNPYTQTISATDKVVLTTATILGRRVAPGETHVPLLHLLARNLYDQPRTLQQLRVRNLTGGAPGASQADRDGAISRVTLRRDGNDNGVLDDLATDPVLLATTFEDGVATFTGMRWQLAPDAVAHLFVTGHVDTSGAADGDTLAAAVGAASEVRFEEPSALVGDWPLSSDGRHPVDGMVAAQVRCPAIPPVSLTAGEGPVLALDLTIPGNGWQADTLADLRLRNEGGAGSGDIAQLALWDDTDGDGVFEPDDDQQLAGLTSIGSDWVALDLDLDVPAAGRRLFAGLTVAETPTDSATVRLGVPTGGLQMASFNDGPRDTVVASPTALLISTAPLLSDVAFTTDRSTTEMTVEAVMTVENVGGETVQGIVPRDVAVTGDGSLSLVEAAQPPSLDLAPGATGTFTWTFAGEATGPVFLTARCEGTGAVGGQTRGSLATASGAHTVLAPATDLGLYPVANMPFSINRGQTGVVPLTLTLLNDGGPERAELRLERLVVTLDDGEGLPVVPAALLSRVAVNEGVNVYCDRTDLETTGSTLTLDLDPAVVVTPLEPVTLGLRLDIAVDTEVPRFRVGLEAPDHLVARDHVSGAARTVTLVEGQFPVRSAAGTIVAQATGLQVTAAPSPPRSVGAGQDAVPLLELQLAATGPDQGSEVRVGGFAVAITDTLGHRLADAASRLAQMSVQGPLATHAVENLSAPDDSVVAFTLSPQVAVPVGAGVVNLRVLGRIATDPVLGPLRLQLEPVAAFDARDANVGAAVPVSYQPDPPTGPAVTVQAAAPALLLGGQGLLPPVITQGARDVPALALTVAHPGGAGVAAARLDTLRIVCLDGAREPLEPDAVLDGFQVRWNGTPLMADAIYGDGELVVPLGGRLLSPGTQAALSVSLDVEVSAPATALELLVQPGSLVAVDANLQTRLAVGAPAGGALPVSSRLSSIQPAAEEVTVAWTDRLPAWLPADGSAAEALVLDLRNPAAAGSAPAQLASLTLRASDRHGRPLAAGALLAAAAVLAESQDWAADQAATTDSTLTLVGAEPLRLPAGETVRLSLRVTPRAGAGPDGLRLELHGGDLACTQPGSSTPVPVRPAAGQAFPVRTAAAGVAATDLAGSYVNYPNPFAAGRGSTDFAFQLAGPATVSLRIWTPRGEAVIDLLHEDDRAAGLHQDVRWDGRNGRGHPVRNGVYLAELTVRYRDGDRERLLRKVAVVR